MSGLSVCLSIVVMLIVAAPVQAQTLEALDIAKGDKLAHSLCVNCHQVAPDQSGPVLADVPSFVSIANRPGMTRQKIESFVLSPHPAMPKVQFTREELSQISGYIMSLRNDDKAN